MFICSECGILHASTEKDKARDPMDQRLKDRWLAAEGRVEASIFSSGETERLREKALSASIKYFGQFHNNVWKFPESMMTKKTNVGYRAVCKEHQ